MCVSLDPLSSFHCLRDKDNKVMKTSLTFEYINILILPALCISESCIEIKIDFLNLFKFIYLNKNLLK